MSASLVGSEMCIRDRPSSRTSSTSRARSPASRVTSTSAATAGRSGVALGCLLYTSDAADDM
eukprot:9851699-Alexandrium_andersonii.AAC.1